MKLSHSISTQQGNESPCGKNTHFWLVPKYFCNDCLWDIFKNLVRISCQSTTKLFLSYLWISQKWVLFLQGLSYTFMNNLNFLTYTSTFISTTDIFHSITAVEPYSLQIKYQYSPKRWWVYKFSCFLLFHCTKLHDKQIPYVYTYLHPSSSII